MTDSMGDAVYDATFGGEDATIKRLERMHPTAEQLLLRMAVEKALMTKQRKVWEMWNYDRLTQPEIAKKLHVSQQAIAQQINTIERQIIKWCREHKEVYDALMTAQNAVKESPNAR